MTADDPTPTGHGLHEDAPRDAAEVLDPLGFGEAWMRTANAAMQNPQAMIHAGLRFWEGMAEATGAAMARMAGDPAAEGPMSPSRRDRRFADPAWEDNPALFALMQGYLLSGRMVQDVLDGAKVDDVTDARMGFLADAVMDALAPTNNLLTNPTATKKAIDSGGASVVQGIRNFLEDLEHNGGLPRQVPENAFTVGKDLAVTPGQVVYRNHLMELIQYSPTTETVHEIPLLLSPPWINKYYIMDLSPGRSFVEWAVSHGHTVFTISYRNPTAADRDVRLDDYLLHGPIDAMDVVRDITGQPKVNIVGLCLGGTLTAALLAYLAAKGDDRVNCVTLLNTLVDFSKPGRLGAFTDRESVERLERRMNERGYLEASEMMGIFTFMRSNDLVWGYVVNNWLMGQEPAAFDILSWNGDSTRMPANMHGFYLRSCYLNNELSQGKMELAGTKLDLTKVTNDVYILAAQEDHIALWEGSYISTQVLPNATVEFVLSSSGHIAGIVNPPSPKGWHRMGEVHPPDPKEWMAQSVKEDGSWWPHWAEWLSHRAGEQTAPPPMGGPKYPPLEPAPGHYVLAD
ncbi:MAG: alpha/beta fold hydrolase [Thermoleophilia bacterium]